MREQTIARNTGINAAIVDYTEELARTGKKLVWESQSFLKRQGNLRVRIQSFHIEVQGQATTEIPLGSPVCIVIACECHDPEVRLIDAGFSVHDEAGERLGILYSAYQSMQFKPPSSHFEIRCTLERWTFAMRTVFFGIRILADGVESDWPNALSPPYSVVAPINDIGIANIDLIGDHLILGSWDVHKK